MNRRNITEYKNVLNALKHGGWTSFHTLMIVLYVLLVGTCITFFCVSFSKLAGNIVLFIFAFLSCIIAIILAILIGIKFIMPSLVKRMEDDRNRENKILSILQEEYEQEHLAEKARIGIIEKYAKATIEDISGSSQE